MAKTSQKCARRFGLREAKRERLIRKWMRLLVEQCGGTVADTDFGADVLLTVQLPAEDTDAFREKVTELSAGKLEPLVVEEQFQPGPRER